MRKLPLTLIAAILVAVVVILASVGLLKTIDATQRTWIASHINTNLKSVVELIQSMAEDDINRVSVIAETPQLVGLATNAIAHPTDLKTREALRAWLIPLYRGRGFVGFSLIGADLQIIDASSPAYIGKKVITAGTLWAIQHADIEGAAISPPIIAPLPVDINGATVGAGARFQQACARIEQSHQRIGFLCLRTDPTQRLFRLLQAGRTGESGEAYVIDTDGRILSPSRLKAQTDLQARVPHSQRINRSSAIAGSEFTEVAARLLQDKTAPTNYLENYQDYRGVDVVGAGQWLPAINMGVIVEEDMEEVFFANRVTHIAIVVLDIVALSAIAIVLLVQYRSGQNLARSEQLLNTILNNIDAYVFLRGKDGRFLYANHKVEAFYERPLKDIVGHSVSEWVPAAFARTYLAADEEVWSSGAKRACNQSIIDAHGNEHRIWEIKMPIQLPGQGTALLCLSTDITELWTLQQELEARVEERTKDLQEARRAAEIAANAKADFLANMSHEIRTPMNAIIGMSYLALQCELSPQARNYLEKIQQASQHLLGIINTILDYSKIEAGKLNIENELFSLQQLIETSMDMVAPKALAKRITLRADCAAGLPQVFIGDSLRIGQVLTNFLSNAVKFTDYGAVVLRVRAADQLDPILDQLRIRFEVEDSGIGIAGHAISQLFQPFQQIDTSSTRRFEGTGLGLAISKHLTELLGGAIEVRSELGKGSTFAVELSLRIGRVETPQNTARPLSNSTNLHAIPNLQGARVLLVEDNDINQEVASDILRSFGTRVEIAGNGIEALALLRQQTFDLVLLDVQMPVLDGYRTAQAIRSDTTLQQPPIIAMTANAMAGDRDRCIAAGMNDYIAKPIEPAQLMKTLHRWMHIVTAPVAETPAGTSLNYSALQKLGLNTEKALRLLMHREALYARVLRRFVDERADIPQQLSAALAPGDYENAGMIVHSLKSLAATIGADYLHELCGTLEKEFRAHNPVDNLCEQFRVELHRLITELTPLLPAAPAQNT